jgi:TctA family transporter
LLLFFQKIFKTNSTYQLVVVFLVFAISGSLSVFVSEPVLNFLNYKEFISSNIFQIIIRILIIFPIYQIILLAVATVFGEFKYFWNFEKRFWKKFKK